MRLNVLSRGLSLLALVVLCITLTSCAQSRDLRHRQTEQQFALQNALPILPLLTPSSAQNSFAASQVLTIKRDGQSHQVESLLQWDSQRIDIAILKLGRRVVTIGYDGSQLDVKKDVLVPDGISGEQILKDIQLVYWPAKALRDFLHSDYTLIDTESERVLLYKDQVLYHIRYHAGGTEHTSAQQTINLTQKQHGYDMTIVSTPILP